MHVGFGGWMLVVHIAAVAAWLGANLVQAFLAAGVRKADPAARLWWARAQGSMGRAYYSVAGVLVLLTGILMVIDQDAYTFKDTFVSIGFAAVIIGIVLGIAVFGPSSRKAAAAIESGDSATEKSMESRVGLFGAIDTLIVLVTIVAMIFKWGVGA